MARPRKSEAERLAYRRDLLRRFAAWERAGHIPPPAYRDVDPQPGERTEIALQQLREEGWIADLAPGFEQTGRKLRMRRDHKIDPSVVAGYFPRAAWPCSPWVERVCVDGGHLIFDVE